MAAPLRTERRPVRPFRGLASFQRALSKIVFSADSQEVEESVTLSSNDLLTSSFSIRLDFDRVELETGLESVPLVPEAISLLIFAKSRTLKQTEIILLESLSTSLERSGSEIAIETSSNPLLFGDVSAGFSVDVALVLAEAIPHEPLKPYLKGTWLGRRKFDVHVERDDALFVPVPLDDVRRRELSLPPGTMSYVPFEVDRSPLEATDIEELLEFLVDDGVLGHIKHVEQSPEARLVMTQLAAELLTAILMRGVRDLEDDSIQLRIETDGRPSIFDRVVAKVAEGQSGVDADRLAEWSKTDPDRVSALVAHAVSLQSETLSMIAGTT
jgi:hypothetical protein